MGLSSKNREYGYYWTLKDGKWTISEYYQNKWTGGVPDEYWDDIDETQIVRELTKLETTSNCTMHEVSNCPYCGDEMKGIKLTHYKCKKCKEYFTD